MIPLSSMKPGQHASIAQLPSNENLAMRLREMGLLRGTIVLFLRSAPLGDPIEIHLRGFELSIRKSDASAVLVELISAESEELILPIQYPAHVVHPSIKPVLFPSDIVKKVKNTATTDVKSYSVVGNPNSGKTTLFNALTGLRQKVANYPGVTVEKKMGQFIGQHGEKIRLLDLPGSYSLCSYAPDERITRDILLCLRNDTVRPERILCIVDVSHLERSLYFISQVLELRLPTIIALNMMDIARNQGIAIKIECLANAFGVPVIPVQATDKKTLLPLRLALSRSDLSSSDWKIAFPSVWYKAIDAVMSEMGDLSVNRTIIEIKINLLLLSTEEKRPFLIQEFGLKNINELVHKQEQILNNVLPNWREIIVSNRYYEIGKICYDTQAGWKGLGDKWTQKFDNILIHKFFGWLIFIGIMSLMFLGIFTIAAYPMEWIDLLFGWCQSLINSQMNPSDLQNLLSDGLIAGIGGVVMFLPQILILFFFIGLLEDSGYMARAAFLMDKVMNRVGLHGKSFIPLLTSYACAIPGIMATRTIENPKDRLITILIAPFMSCSARLPVYSLMIGTMLPVGSVFQKAEVMMGLYFLGTITALLIASLLKRTILRGDSTLFIMELPPYRFPSWSQIFQQIFNRAVIFLHRAGTVILSLSVIFWFMTHFPKNSSDKCGDRLEYSYAGRIGHAIEPLIKPIGMDWKIGICLIAAQTAREVFCSTLAIVYHAEQIVGESPNKLKDILYQQKKSDGKIVFTPLTSLSIMLFFVFSMQCFSTVAIVRRETNSFFWPIFQFVFMTTFAYAVSFFVYQIGIFLGFH